MGGGEEEERERERERPAPLVLAGLNQKWQRQHTSVVHTYITMHVREPGIPGARRNAWYTLFVLCNDYYVIIPR